MAKTTFKGGCHCGYVRYEVAVDLPSDGPPQAGRCNCTICTKLGFTSLKLPSPDDFKLVSPASLDDMGDYTVNVKHCHRYFCTKCGVHIYGQGYYDWEGQRMHFYQVNLSTLDQPQDGLDLSEWKMTYVDGLNDNFMAGAKDKPWPNGLV